MTLCRWCSQEITLTETHVGFGDGDTQQFVHTQCYDNYERILAKLQDEEKSEYEFLVFVHRTLIDSLERMYERIVEGVQ